MTRTYTLTSAPAQEVDVADRWVRLPGAKQREYHTGLSRAHIYALIKAGEIKSSSLKRRGTLRGVRVVHLRSLLDYVEKHAVEVNS